MHVEKNIQAKLNKDCSFHANVRNNSEPVLHYGIAIVHDVPYWTKRILRRRCDDPKLCARTEIEFLN